MKRVIEGTLALILLAVFVFPAEALNITLAEVQNDLAVVQGNKAAKEATITWEGGGVTQANKGGSFGFSGGVPADCVGTLSDGFDTIDVALNNCTPVAEAPAPVPRTGQTQCWDVNGTPIDCTGTGQDGDIQAGAELPIPRFTDNLDGTVTDNATGLIWLQDANCLGSPTWEDAPIAANNLADGDVACGLTDQSNAGDWRFPNRNELMSLLDLGMWNPALPAGHPFLNYNHSAVCTSTSLNGAPEKIWLVSLASGQVIESLKAHSCRGVGTVTAVRGP